MRRNRFESNTCSQCKRNVPGRKFDYARLAALREDNQVYLAVCLDCNPALTTDRHDKPEIICVGCEKLKPRKDFSIARLRCHNPKTWFCIACDFPACTGCGTKPSMPKQAPYTCDGCLWPPCIGCGAARPKSTKYRSTNEGKEHWTCAKCKENQESHGNSLS